MSENTTSLLRRKEQERAWARIASLKAMLARVFIERGEMDEAVNEVDECCEAAVKSCNARCLWNKRDDRSRQMHGCAKRALIEYTEISHIMNDILLRKEA